MSDLGPGEADQWQGSNWLEVKKTWIYVQISSVTEWLFQTGQITFFLETFVSLT